MLYPLYWLFILVCTGCWVWHIFVLFPMTNGMMIPNDWHRSRRWLNMAQPPSGTCVSMIIVHPSWSIIECVYIYCISCVLCIMNIYEHLWTFMNIYEPRYHVVFHVVFHVFWQDNSPLCGVSPQESAGSLDMLVAIALVRTTQWPISLRPKCLVKNDGSMKVSLW